MIPETSAVNIAYSSECKGQTTPAVGRITSCFVKVSDASGISTFSLVCPGNQQGQGSHQAVPLPYPDQVFSALFAGKVVVVGIGNPAAGDDAAGCLVAERLLAAGCAGVINAEEVPENAVGPIMAARPDTVVLVDAVDLRAEPGSLAILDRTQLTSYCPSTHRVPVTLLMRYIGEVTGARVLLVGIQPQTVGFGLPMSAAVEATVVLLADVFRQLIGAEGRDRRRPSC